MKYTDEDVRALVETLKYISTYRYDANPKIARLARNAEEGLERFTEKT